MVGPGAAGKWDDPKDESEQGASKYEHEARIRKGQFIFYEEVVEDDQSRGTPDPSRK